MNNLVLVPVSPGDVLDRLSILHIKEINAHSKEKQQIIKKESELIERAWITCFGDSPKNRKEFDELLLINSELWKLEDEIRSYENLQIFEKDFISAARKIYLTNDKRARLKANINKIFNSDLYDIKLFNNQVLRINS